METAKSVLCRLSAEAACPRFRVQALACFLRIDNLKVDVMKQAPPTANGKLAASALDMRLKGGAMETIYIGVDFHARQQTICYLTTNGGEILLHVLKHQDKEAVCSFYAQF